MNQLKTSSRSMKTSDLSVYLLLIFCQRHVHPIFRCCIANIAILKLLLLCCVATHFYGIYDMKISSNCNQNLADRWFTKRVKEEKNAIVNVDKTPTRNHENAVRDNFHRFFFFFWRKVVELRWAREGKKRRKNFNSVSLCECLSFVMCQRTGNPTSESEMQNFCREFHKLKSDTKN